MGGGRGEREKVGPGLRDAWRWGADTRESESRWARIGWLGGEEGEGGGERGERERAEQRRERERVEIV